MNRSYQTVSVPTSKKVELVDITSEVEKAVSGSDLSDGVCLVYVPHTTAAVTINENADPSVQSDMIMGIEQMVPLDPGYNHAEGNSTAHIKSSLVGNSVSIIIEEGRLVLGTWQGVYFCEFDGPRTRKVYVKIS